MNILFFINRYPNYGGTEKVTSVLANYFAEKGYGVTLVSCDQPEPDANELSAKVKFFAMGQPVKSKKNIQQLHNILINQNVDLLINQFCLPYYSNQLCKSAMKDTNAKLISVLHGVPDRSKIVINAENEVKYAGSLISKFFLTCKLLIIDWIVKSSIKYVYRNSDSYVVLSNGFIKKFQDYTGLKTTDKLLSIGNPITIPTQYSSSIVSAKKKQILYVGRMDITNKNVNRILNTWKLLYADYPDWNLCLVGGGPDLETLKKQAEADSLERVIFTGFVKNEPIQYYKDSTILMLTSDLEGFGLVVVEGMSYGVIPVVYGSYVSIYDMIENGKHGYITPKPFSAEITASHLRGLMSNECICKQMASAAIERSKFFSIESVCEQWESLFNKLLQ